MHRRFEVKTFARYEESEMNDERNKWEDIEYLDRLFDICDVDEKSDDAENH
jgi:hypothetical protein